MIKEQWTKSEITLKGKKETIVYCVSKIVFIEVIYKLFGRVTNSESTALLYVVI